MHEHGLEVTRMTDLALWNALRANVMYMDPESPLTLHKSRRKVIGRETEAIIRELRLRGAQLTLCD